MMNKASMAGLMVLAMGAGAAQAADDVVITNLGVGAVAQDNFKKLSEDLSAATNYKALSPAEALGITGFDIGVELTATSLQYTDEFDIACGGCGVETIAIPKIHLHKGLPMGIDVGMVHSSGSNTNVSLTGFELRYAIIDGGIAMPALAVRMTYSMLDGIDDLELESRGVELSLSKGFAMLTPYVGVGQHWTTSTPAASTGLKEEDFTQTKYVAGFNLNLGLINFDFEADNTGEAQTIGAKVGIRF